LANPGIKLASKVLSTFVKAFHKEQKPQIKPLKHSNQSFWHNFCYQTKHLVTVKYFIVLPPSESGLFCRFLHISQNQIGMVFAIQKCSSSLGTVLATIV